MNISTIDPNKHIGILFEPRSGSHVVRYFLSNITNRANLGETFNPLNGNTVEKLEFTNKTFLKGNSKFVDTLVGLRVEITDELIKNISLPEAITNLKTLKVEAELNNYTTFSIYPTGYAKFMPEFLNHLASADDIQCIRLERADVLTSILSSIMAIKNNNWHYAADNNIMPIEYLSNLKLEKIKILIEPLEFRLNSYVEKCMCIDKYFPNVTTIYYEQFQNNVTNLRNMFNGIPKKIISIPYLKLGINYKEWIKNLDEVEDFYEHFVNEHKEYFPQYFGKLPHVKIPVSQGRQPRDLSQLQMAVGI